MKYFKIFMEAATWVFLYIPFYFLFNYLDYLSKNEWGVKNSERPMQLFFVILLTAIAAVFIFFVFRKLLYVKLLIERKYNVAKTIVKGRGVLENIFLTRHIDYYDIGETYTPDKLTAWYDVNGNEIGRVQWIDQEVKRIKAIEKIKK